MKYCIHNFSFYQNLLFVYIYHYKSFTVSQNTATRGNFLEHSVESLNSKLFLLCSSFVHIKRFEMHCLKNKKENIAVRIWCLLNIYFPQAKFHKIRIFCWIAWVTLVYTRVLLTREVTCCKDTSYYCIVIDSGTNAHGDDKMFTAKLYILSLVLICSTLSYHFIIENLWALLLIAVSS